MARGKRLTVAQMKELQANGIKDVKNWQYIKTVRIDGITGDPMSKNESKTMGIEVRNITTGETRQIPMS